ncbi:MAG: DUF4293 domain-containing protein [Bacteroides sp.]|nr:DUF4293 domain-containing protein [Bacteroides sp.]MBD5362944.1 DUF4293 domain-containing protein [Bacteroides sp.]
MQIQRIQSVYLLIAVIASVALWFLPWIHIESASIDASPTNNITFGILNTINTLLPLITIFLYRNLRRQKHVCMLAIFLGIVSIGCIMAETLYLHYHDVAASTGTASIFCFVVMLFFELLAHRAMIRDENLLKSADRIR